MRLGGYDAWLNDSAAYERYADGPLPPRERDPDRERDAEIDKELCRPGRSAGNKEKEKEKEMEPPKRAIQFTLNLQADTVDALLNALENIQTRIAMNEMTQGVSGGCDSGYSYKLTQNPGPTHDEYVAQLKEYIQETKEEE